VVGLLSMLLLAGCSSEDVDQIQRLALPPPASDAAPHMAALWQGAWIAVAATGLLVWGLILWAVVRYRRRGDDDTPSQTRYNVPIEVLYTVVPIIVVAVFFYFTIVVQNEVLDQGHSTEHEVMVLGAKWNWNFTYMHDKALDGQTNVFDTGTPADLPVLWLPVDESVDFELRSNDVVHSFWIPSFYFKMDVIPGRDNHFEMTATKTGEFAGRCAELCGLYHSRMLFTVKVVTADEYAQHLKDLQDIGQVGVQAPNSYVSNLGGDAISGGSS
jgi:cytochrome c oxidase subunit II